MNRYCEASKYNLDTIKNGQKLNIKKFREKIIIQINYDIIRMMNQSI